MAMSLGVFSSFLPADKVSFCNSSSFATIRLVPANVRVSRSMTISAAAKPATETKNREPRGIMKPRRVSKEMQAFLGGASEVPRTQVVKEIWAYIKQHNLQAVQLLDYDTTMDDERVISTRPVRERRRPKRYEV
ncbi:hypothetical protein OROMI_031490 [Orobanche minor]